MSATKVYCLSMASMALIVLIGFMHMSSTEAAVYSQRAIFHPAYPGKCYDKFTRRAMLPNKEYRPKGICASLTCDLESQLINIETCPTIEMPGCEELPTNPSWTFPKCCPQFKCTDFKTGKEFVVSV
ncbi:uncharacterized protein ACRADG_002565 [Cochliomyia hominivorax]